MRKGLVLAISFFAVSGDAVCHEIPWPRGMSRNVGFGACAKGPCMRRTSYSATVPHRHMEVGKCIGMGAAGYTKGSRFDCPPDK